MEYWTAIWSSPMAVVYTDVDVFPLTRLILLVHEREMGESGWTGDGEIRQLEDRFGISPLARRRLAWEIGNAGSNAPDAPPPRRGIPAAERLGRLDPSVLKIVS